MRTLIALLVIISVIGGGYFLLRSQRTNVTQDMYDTIEIGDTKKELLDKVDHQTPKFEQRGAFSNDDSSQLLTWVNPNESYVMVTLMNGKVALKDKDGRLD